MSIAMRTGPSLHAACVVRRSVMYTSVVDGLHVGSFDDERREDFTQRLSWVLYVACRLARKISWLGRCSELSLVPIVCVCPWERIHTFNKCGLR